MTWRRAAAAGGRPHRIARISFDTRFQGGRRHSVAKHPCLPVTMASEFLNIAVARTCGGAKMFLLCQIVLRIFFVLNLNS